MRNFIFTLIKECELIGLRIDAIITDMGPGNQAIWSICGIGATKHGKTSVSCAHPCANGSDRQLYFIADAPHVLKNLRGHLVRGQLISIPDEIVERNKLPTSEVKFPSRQSSLAANPCKLKRQLYPCYTLTLGGGGGVLVYGKRA